MSQRDHAAIEELLAVRALGGLDGDDAARLDEALAAHGACATCRALEAEFADTAAMLAMSLSPVEVDPAMIDRVLGAGPTAVADPADELAARRARRPRPWRALVAVAAAFLLVMGGLTVVRARTQRIEGTNWAQEVVRFQGDGGGELAMAYVPGTTGAAFWGSGLPDPGEGKTYEIWMIDDETPIPGGCVRPVDGRVSVFVRADVGSTELMAVTVEPASCPAAPTGDIVLTAPLV